MEEFREIILFTLSCIGAVIVITVYAAFGGLTAQMAEVRHEEIRGQYDVEFERIYGVYNESCISGVEAIALFRENALNKAQCTIVMDKNAADNPMEQNTDNYNNFTFSALKTLIDADGFYHVTVDGYTINLIRR